MDEPGNSDDLNGSAEHFTSDRSLEEKLRERLAEVVRLLALADAEGKRAGPAAFRLLEIYRGPFVEAMVDFGEILADFLAADYDAPAFLESPAFSEQLRPLLDIARTAPVFRRTQEWGRGGIERDDLQRVALSASQPAFDLPTMLLGDFFNSLAMARSYRVRFEVLSEWVRTESRTRADTLTKPVRLLKLPCGSTLEMEPLLSDAKCVANLYITYVDEDITALRRMRQYTEKRLAHRPRFLWAELLTLASNPNRPRAAFDIVYAFGLFSTWTLEQIAYVLRMSYAFLKPGGVLFIGGFLPDVPRSEKALLTGLMGVQAQYLDETDWRRLLRAASFDLDNTRLERLAPSTILVAARRATEPQG